jgi:molybdopterin/thiamine biosynthesis adenylyltransferase
MAQPIFPARQKLQGDIRSSEVCVVGNAGLPFSEAAKLFILRFESALGWREVITGTSIGFRF